jgi:hypothetical protein
VTDKLILGASIHTSQPNQFKTFILSIDDLH